MASSLKAIVTLALLAAGCASRPALVDGIDTPFAAAGDAARGREVFVSREGGHCVLCHAVPGVEVAGDIGPPLGGIGSRYTPAQLRLRVADMPAGGRRSRCRPFHRTEGLNRVAAEFRGKPALSGQQVEDVVAWLSTLK
jgi:sulfur-oxidizing protein SoxX